MQFLQAGNLGLVMFIASLTLGKEGTGDDCRRCLVSISANRALSSASVVGLNECLPRRLHDVLGDHFVSPVVGGGGRGRGSQ